MKTGNSGFTLIESILSLLLLAMVAAAVFGFMTMGVESYYFSAENSRAASEMKPMYDYMSARMSDMTQICCFSQSRIEFYNTEDGATCSDVNAPTPQALEYSSGALIMTTCTGPAGSRTCNNWTMMDNLENGVFTRTLQSVTMEGSSGTYVDDIGISLQYKSDRDGSDLDKTFDIQFSPRYLIDSAIPGC